jgi:hypothetical protein
VVDSRKEKAAANWSGHKDARQARQSRAMLFFLGPSIVIAITIAGLFFIPRLSAYK